MQATRTFAVVSVLLVSVGACAAGSEDQVVMASSPGGAGLPVARPQPSEEPLRVGDAPPEGNTAEWVDEAGSPRADRVPIWIPVCDGPAGCKEIVGFVHRADIFAEFAEADDPINTVLGYQPPPTEVRGDDRRELVGYLLEEGFVTVEEHEARASTPALAGEG